MKTSLSPSSNPFQGHEIGFNISQAPPFHHSKEMSQGGVLNLFLEVDGGCELLFIKFILLVCLYYLNVMYVKIEILMLDVL